MGNPSIEVMEENQDATHVEKSKTILAIYEGTNISTITHVNTFRCFFLHCFIGE